MQGRGKQDGSRKHVQGLPVVLQDAAGIDLGSQQHWVCAAAADGTGREISNFGATTPELIRMADWMKQRKVRSVAMESTGVYWVARHEVLESQGFEVLLVSTRQLAQVPGRDRKSDPADCEWIQRLHSCGLLSGSFRPKEAVCMVRTLVRDKGNLVAEAGDWLRRMQKSLDQMNVRVHRAVSDIDGSTGMAILRAIASGERDAVQLAKLRDPHCKKSEQEIAEQLTGHWREDHVFSLRQSLKMYDAIQQRIAEYEQEILRKLGEMEREELRGQPMPPAANAVKQRTLRRRGQEPMREAWYRMSGVDLTEIDSVGVESVQVVLTEYGPDLSRFPTEKQFVAHATLAPRRATSGGKRVKKNKRQSASTRVAAVLRMAALSQRHSQTALGAYYRKLASRLGADIAVFATARRLATYIYRLLRWGKKYVDEGAEAFEKRYQQNALKILTAKAKKLGYQLQPMLT